MAHKKGINPVTAGVVGVAVGAAVGVAAVELADPKKRKVVQKKLGELKDKGAKAYTELKKDTDQVKAKIEEFSGSAGAKIEEAKS